MIVTGIIKVPLQFFSGPFSGTISNSNPNPNLVPPLGQDKHFHYTKYYEKGNNITRICKDQELSQKGFHSELEIQSSMLNHGLNCLSGQESASGLD